LGAVGQADHIEDHDGDREMVRRLLGREPLGPFEVVVRRDDGWPVVLANPPFQDGGRPMPTRYWLADRRLVRAVGRLEAEGGVGQAEAEVDPDALRAAHDAYGTERDRLIDPAHQGPRPYGGVGGTRQGVKCLHAHYANYLAGATDDPVGEWVQCRLQARGLAYDPARPAQVPA
jgi:hypothetical protein